MVGGLLVFCRQYHGGTNFGRTAGGTFITPSYDDDAPIDEYGEFTRRMLIFLGEHDRCVTFFLSIKRQGIILKKNAATHSKHIGAFPGLYVTAFYKVI